MRALSTQNLGAMRSIKTCCKRYAFGRVFGPWFASHQVEAIRCTQGQKEVRHERLRCDREVRLSRPPRKDTLMSKTAKKARSLTDRLRRHPLASLREELDDVMERVFGGDDACTVGRNAPALDLSDTENTIEAKLDLPGIDPDEVDIRINRNLLTVSGERKEEEVEKGRTFYRVERRTGAFSRSITLPAEVNEDEVAAEYKDGVLTITLPKAEQAKARKIKVAH
jgi:HSP20 family protein